MPSTAASRTAKDAGDIVLQSSVSAVTATLTAVTTASIAVAAGASTVPVAGWIVSAVAIVLAALTTLTERLLTAKIRRSEAVQWARMLGLPEPEKIPGFIVDLHLASNADRVRMAADLTREIEAARDSKRKVALERKRGLVAIVLTREWLAANAARLRQPSPVPPAAPRAVLRIEYGGGWTPYVVAGMLVATAGVLLFA